MIHGYARVSTDAPELTTKVARLNAVGCGKVYRGKFSDATAERSQLKRLMNALHAGDVVIIPPVDCLSRDTTDPRVIARDIQQAGAGLRSLAKPVLDTTSDFAELVPVMLGVAAKLEHRRSPRARRPRSRRCRGRRGEVWPKAQSHPPPAAGSPEADRRSREQRSVARSFNVSQATISRLTA